MTHGSSIGQRSASMWSLPPWTLRGQLGGLGVVGGRGLVVGWTLSVRRTLQAGLLGTAQIDIVDPGGEGHGRGPP